VIRGGLGELVLNEEEGEEEMGREGAGDKDMMKRE